MRKSVALLSVLIFLILLLSVLNTILVIYSDSTKNGFYNRLTQNSLIINDTLNILNSFEVNDSETLDLIFNDFLIGSKDGKLNLNVEISPLSDKINLNEMKIKKVCPYLKNYIYNILNFYEVDDPEAFINILVSFYQKKENFLIDDPLLKEKKIYSFKHFKELLKIYANEMRDNKIFKIPWSEYIYFAEANITQIDCERIDKKVAKFLGLEFDEAFECEEAKKSKKNKKIMNILDIIPFTKKLPYYAKIKISYNDNNISIIYDISKKKAIDIEYNTIY